MYFDSVIGSDERRALGCNDDDAMRQGRELLSALCIPQRTMINYLSVLEQHYRPTVAYHNSIHAADVTQTSHVMLLAPALEVSNTQSPTPRVQLGFVDRLSSGFYGRPM